MRMPTFENALALGLADGQTVVLATCGLRLLTASFSGPVYYRTEGDNVNYQHRNLPLSDVSSVSRYEGDAAAAIDGNGRWLIATLGNDAPPIPGLNDEVFAARATAAAEAVTTAANVPGTPRIGATVRIHVYATGADYVATVQSIVPGRSQERDRFFLRLDRGESMVLARSAANFEVVS